MAWNIASKIVHRVVTIDENHTVLDAATLMAEEFVGSALITSFHGARLDDARRRSEARS